MDSAQVRWLEDNTTSPSSELNITTNETWIEEIELPQREHEGDAAQTLLLNVAIIGCLLLAYYVKANQIYHIPESAAALLAGMVIGGITRLVLPHLKIFVFETEVFFFILLPPIIFEAGYSLKRKSFFDNIGAITLFAVFGTMISTAVVGSMVFWVAKLGIVQGIDSRNPMEGLLFGALISAVDPVATLSILGNPELQCDQLLYSLVFGESVLNDATSIVIFNTLLNHWSPEGSEGDEWSSAGMQAAFAEFAFVYTFSIFVGVGMGLMSSFLFKQSSLSEYPTLETSLLLCFCYLCYSAAEAMNLSGIMALFFNGIVLSHYNSYNLSSTAYVASEQIFSTLATVAETTVFLYMGLSVFTGRFSRWDVTFSALALAFCLVGRFLNIVPLSFLANCCRRSNRRISCKMQGVLWFAGLRGAIAFALSEGMPGSNKETYATATLSICVFTTVVCGGFTEKLLTCAGMKQSQDSDDEENDDEGESLVSTFPMARRVSGRVYQGIKGIWKEWDDRYLKPNFGGSNQVRSHSNGHDNNDLRSYELTGVTRPSSVYDDDQDA